LSDKIKKGDFIEIEYTGKEIEENIVFDTTDKDIADKEGLSGQGNEFGPAVVCVGEKHLLPGLDAKVPGLELQKSYEIELTPEEAFGKKSAKAIQLVSTSKFKSQKINPYPGLQINIDGMMGTIKTVTGGRTLVDFNHPLAGKHIQYKIKVNKIIKEPAEQAHSFIKLRFGEELRTELQDGEFTIYTKVDIPEDFDDSLKKDLKRLIPEIKKVTFKKS
jgi:FKBP-type peptidyl-prolyl cis-trans isomerase 2